MEQNGISCNRKEYLGTEWNELGQNKISWNRKEYPGTEWNKLGQKRIPWKLEQNGMGWDRI